MRGKLSRSFGVKTVCRITPADAGKTKAQSGLNAGLRDHPRRCGENDLPSALLIYQPGSPPQVRGKLSPTVGLLFVIRITPAGAGKTGMKKSLTLAKKDHPRRCGENKKEWDSYYSEVGSPPQVRGKLSH